VVATACRSRIPVQGLAICDSAVMTDEPSKFNVSPAALVDRDSGVHSTVSFTEKCLKTSPTEIRVSSLKSELNLVRQQLVQEPSQLEKKHSSLS